MDADYDDFPESEPPRDSAIDEALPRVLQMFRDSPTQVFYSTQIETRLERDYFHWITNKALSELGNGGKLQRMTEVVQGRGVNFYAHPTLRYWRREQQRLQKLLEKMFDPDFTHAVGRHGEMMFDSALSRHGFMLQPGRDLKSWNGRTWTETNHNLDRIVTRDGVAYGIEIKNMQNYIQRDELYMKLRICEYLGLVPLFIMRFAPKNYMHAINQAKGFGLLFDEQIYPFGYDRLLSEVRETLGLKVQCPRDIPAGHMQRLLNWHERLVKRLSM